MIDPIRIVLVDDEAASRKTIRLLMATGCPEATIVGEASSLAGAIELLSRVTPDVLLLDVELEDGTGFDLLDRFPHPQFKVVFTTAHDEFALRAFRYSVLDYLLKPVDPGELVAAVRRAAEPGDPQAYRRQLEQLRYNTTTRQFDRITLNTGNGLLFVQTGEIVRLESKGNYCFVFLENGERHLVARSLVTFEEILPSRPFFRAHQSHLVNTIFVRKLVKDDGDSLLMTDKTVVPLARRRREAFIKVMGEL